LADIDQRVRELSCGQSDTRTNDHIPQYLLHLYIQSLNDADDEACCMVDEVICMYYDYDYVLCGMTMVASDPS